MASSNLQENKGSDINGDTDLVSKLESTVEDNSMEDTHSEDINGIEIDWSSILEYDSNFYKEKMNSNNFFIRWIKCSKLVAEPSVEDLEAEIITRLKEHMEYSIMVLEQSNMYHEILDQWQNNSKFRSNIDRVLSLGSSSSSMSMVIYALGSIESSYRSRFQLALAILLKRDFPDLINDIESFDPDTSPTDAKVMEIFGCKVLSDNEECERRIEKPTLFYMPSALHEHRANLLEANWCPSRLNQMILLTNGFENTMEDWRENDEKYSRKIPFWKPHPKFWELYYEVRYSLDYIEAIQKYTVEFPITKTSENLCRSPFGMFSFHFFNLDPELGNMDSLLNDVPLREMRLKTLSKIAKQWNCTRQIKEFFWYL